MVAAMLSVPERGISSRLSTRSSSFYPRRWGQVTPAFRPVGNPRDIEQRLMRAVEAINAV